MWGGLLAWFVRWYNITGIRVMRGVCVCVCLTHIYIWDWAPRAPWIKFIPSINKYYLCRTQTNMQTRTHTHNRPSGWHSAGLLAEGMRQWQWCLCGGEFNPGETMEPTALSRLPPAPPPLRSRRERQPRNVSRACRKMAICSQRFVGFVARLRGYDQQILWPVTSGSFMLPVQGPDTPSPFYFPQIFPRFSHNPQN